MDTAAIRDESGDGQGAPGCNPMTDNYLDSLSMDGLAEFQTTLLVRLYSG
jgi:hypothetical protein